MSAEKKDPAGLSQANEALRREIEGLRARLDEAEEVLRAIHAGEVDALIVGGPEGDRVFTLTSAEQAYRILIEQMREGALTLARDGTIHYANRALADMLGCPLEKIMGRPIHAFVAEADQSGLDALLAEGAGRRELALRAEAGESLPVQVSAGLLPMQDPADLCLVVTDLTERKHHEARILQLNEELEQRVRQRTAQLQAANDVAQQAREAAEQASRAKDQFLAILSHELRTPLTPVLLVTSLLRTEPELPPAIREDIELIHHSVEMEARIIDDLLDLTRIIRGKLDLHMEVLDAHALLRAALKICQGQIEEKNISVATSLRAAQHNLWGDAGRIQQVFWNVLSNAAKFTPQGGRIEVQTFNDHAGRLILQVKDTGVGIEPEALPRIFNAFEQGETTMVRKFGGLGLGLTISKTMVDLHKGSITAASEGKDKGATFTITFDTVAAQVREPAPSAPRLRIAQPESLRILVVEDHPETRRTIAHELEKAGYDVKGAGSVAEALQLADQAAFDLLISDIGLPDGTGIQIMKEVKARYGLKGIALSGFGMEEDIRNSRDAGFEHHLTKPVEFQTLLEVIQRIAS